MKFTAEFGIYLNASIYGTEKRSINASNMSEAEDFASLIASEIEEQIREDAKGTSFEDHDVWVDIEELY